MAPASTIVLLKEQIDGQLEMNRGKNLFSPNLPEVIGFHGINPDIFESMATLDEAAEIILLDYVVDKVMQEFCRVNQFYAFDEKALKKLRLIYSDLLSKLKISAAKGDTAQVKLLIHAHFENLRSWLQNSNPFSEILYTGANDTIEGVACAEYSVQLQLQLCKIATPGTGQPVLDIGCGKTGALVAFLRQMGIEAYGIDRFNPTCPFVERANWLEYDYGTNKWGAIISHLGFSNHFSHHHTRTDGHYTLYAKKYMDILYSLTIGGTFYYVPGLPFIEQYVDRQTFRIQMNKIENSPYNSTSVTRLK